jgi:hypothetical protein
LWGRLLGRSILCAAGIFVGLWLGGPVAQHVSVDPAIVRIVTAFILGLLGLALAGPIWAFLTGGLFAVIAEVIVLRWVLNDIPIEDQPVFEAAGPSLGGWAFALSGFTIRCLTTLWMHKPIVTLAAVFPAGIAPFLLALARRRLATIFMTSLLGAMGLVFGLILTTSRIYPSLWGGFWAHWQIPAALGATLMVTGIAYQYSRALTGSEETDEEETETSDKTERKQPQKTEKKQ